MKNIAFLATILFGSATALIAADSDSGYGPRPGMISSARSDSGYGYGSGYGSGYGDTSRFRRTADQGFLKPTQRYFGKGYTIAYRFVRSDSRSSRLRGGSPEFDAAAYRVAGNTASSFGSESPRIITYQIGKPSSSVQPRPPISAGAARSMVTQPSTPVKDLPPIAEEKK